MVNINDVIDILFSQFVENQKEVNKKSTILKLETIKNEFHIKTISDLLNIYPSKHVVRNKIEKIADIKDNYLKAEVEITGFIDNVELKEPKNVKNKKYLSAQLFDKSGSIKLIWFKNIENMMKLFKNNIEQFIIKGTIEKFNNEYFLSHPSFSTTKSKTVSRNIVTSYPSVSAFSKVKIDQRFFRKIFDFLFENLNDFEDYLPQNIIDKYKMVSEYKALRYLHKPDNFEQLRQSQRRLKFDELFLLQLKRQYFDIDRKQNNSGIICNNLELLNKFYKEILENKLKLTLTDDQKKVIREIFNDLKSGIRMNRLLQGDVGCGKTIVAFIISLIVIGSKYQVTILVPTEILAIQHYNKLKNWCLELNINIALLTGSTKTVEKKEILENIFNGNINLIIGTHSLLNDSIIYNNLGLVIIDEQHKFGVLQRSNVVKHNNNSDNNKLPHMLLMSATPIPRTLAMTLYDNFSISSIHQLPSNRKGIKTIHIDDSLKEYMFNRIREEINKGRQCYFIYPLIEESGKVNLKNISQGYSELNKYFYDLEIGVIHGGINIKDREIIMEKFKNNEINILMATTVIEVGIDVPNATIIVIEEADRYGLAQLHQIRGRVGRGDYESYCFLVTKRNISKNSKERMKALVQYSDGFNISEIDLKLRGGGDIFGKEQSGEFKLKIADIYNDINILTVAKNESLNILNYSNDLEKYPKLKKKIEEENVNLGNIV